MSERSYTLVQQWLQQAALDGDSLQQLVADKPYFSAAQLLLFKRLDTNSELFAQQKKVAALHVYNPIQLEAQTSDFPFDWNEEESNPANSTENFVEPEPTSLEEKEMDTFDNVDEAPTLAEQEFIKAEPIGATDELTTDIESQKEKETFSDTLENKEIELAEEENDTEATEMETREEISAESDNRNKALEEVEMPAIKLPSFDLNAPQNAATGAITFEPFHTVDYFASQGIKLSQTEASNDRFGKQVKSFTEWLKTMKKLPTTAITHNTDGAGESKVANLAAHSLQNTDVVTESMAEVWVKQGNIQKASELYNKLSLQNPSKKAYFAAKIESLKKPS